MKNELKVLDFELIFDNHNINFGFVEKLIKRHDDNVECVKTIFEGLKKMNMQYNSDMLNCIVKTYNNRTISSGDVFYTVEEAIVNVDCYFWCEMLDVVKIREYMDYTAYKDMLNMFRTRNKEKNIPFDHEHVIGFLETLLSNKDMIFASRIEGLLNSLDKGYKSNQGNQLSGVLVLNAPSYEHNLGYEKVNIIKDLRQAIQQLFKLEIDVMDTQNLIYACKGDEDWCPIDQDLMRMKAFKNGNVHLHLSDVVYEKINEVLYHLNKNILDYDTSKLKRKPYKFKGVLN